MTVVGLCDYNPHGVALLMTFRLYKIITGKMISVLRRQFHYASRFRSVGSIFEGKGKVAS